MTVHIIGLIGGVTTTHQMPTTDSTSDMDTTGGGHTIVVTDLGFGTTTKTTMVTHS